MDVEILRQLDQGLLALDRGYSDLSLEGRAVVLARSSRHGHLLARGSHAPMARKIHLSRLFSFPEPPLYAPSGQQKFMSLHGVLNALVAEKRGIFRAQLTTREREDHQQDHHVLCLLIAPTRFRLAGQTGMQIEAGDAQHRCHSESPRVCRRPIASF
jgi:hypothetical protein